DTFYLGHRVTNRKTVTQTGTDQQIAFTNISGIGYMPQTQAIQIASAFGYGAHAITIYLHGNGMSRVSNQQHPTAMLAGFDDLAHQAKGIKNRLAFISTFPGSTVNDNRMVEWIRGNTDELRNQYAILQNIGSVHQL